MSRKREMPQMWQDAQLEIVSNSQPVETDDKGTKEAKILREL